MLGVLKVGDTTRAAISMAKTNKIGVVSAFQGFNQNNIPRALPNPS